MPLPAPSPNPRTAAQTLWVAVIAILAVGGLIWLWVGNWRWPVTALVIGFVVFLTGSVIIRPPAP